MLTGCRAWSIYGISESIPQETAIQTCRGTSQRQSYYKGRKLYLRGSFEDKTASILAEVQGMWIIVDRDIRRWMDAKL